MPQETVCNTEERGDGVKICGLHQQPLRQVVASESMAAPLPYPAIESAWICPVSEKAFMLPNF
jgi:hypothetical protein